MDVRFKGAAEAGMEKARLVGPVGTTGTEASSRFEESKVVLRVDTIGLSAASGEGTLRLGSAICCCLSSFSSGVGKLVCKDGLSAGGLASPLMVCRRGTGESAGSLEVSILAARSEGNGGKLGCSSSLSSRVWTAAATEKGLGTEGLGTGGFANPAIV